VAGRVDKEKFGLECSVIVGEDGGMYAAVNSLDAKLKKVLSAEYGEDYLADKVRGRNSEGKEKVVLGQGSFGKVRFALSLVIGAVAPGELVCMKKSKNFEQLGKEISSSPLDGITDTTLDDYFTSAVAKMVYAPKIYDMAIVTDKSASPH
jgi:hypothetical protein